MFWVGIGEDRMTHRCIDCKKYHMEKDEEGYGYECDDEQKQEDSDHYRGKKYYEFWEWAHQPMDENDCPKFIPKLNTSALGED